MKRSLLRRGQCVGLLLFGFSLSGPVRAESLTPPPSASVEVVPPELTQFVEAHYPEAAEQQRLEADVVLSLEIDENGTVTRATVVEPVANGFDEAAQAAASAFQFRPARRGDRAIKSKILYRYSFRLRAAAVEEKVTTATLSLSVVVAGGKVPIAGAKVRVRRGSRLIADAVSDANGRFQLRDIEPGRYDITLEADGFEPYTVEETLSPAEEAALTLGLVEKSSDTTVIVHGERPTREVTRRTITRRELSLVPGTSGDALRAIQNLPGVARPPALSGLLVVRGSADRTTPVFVDGMWIANVYHFGGLSSVIPTEMLDEINFYPGNFSVRYGRALGGVVDAHFRETRQDGRYHGLAQVDLIDARVLLEGPVPGVSGWNFIGAARRSHVDAWLGPLLNGRDTYISAAPVYYDYQFIADHRFSERSYIRAGFIGYDDRFKLISKGAAFGGQLDTVSATVGLGIVYQNRLSNKAKLDLTFSAARSHQHLQISSVAFDIVSLGMIGRGELEYRLQPRATLRVGYDLLLAPYDVTGRLPEDAGSNAPDVGSPVTTPGQKLDRNAFFFVPAAYAEMDMRPTSRAQVVSGVRYDYTRETGRHDIAPRLTARYDLHSGFPKTTLKAGSGLFFQAPGLIETALNNDHSPLRSQRSFQNSLGVEQQLSSQVKLSVEGFFNLLDNLVSRSVDTHGELRYNNEGKGRIFGSEVLLRYEPDERFFGWVSYTLSRSERTWVPGEPSHLFDLDQTHILTALGSYELGKNWTLGMRFRYVTGNLFTPCSGGLFSSTGTSYLCVNGPLNSERLPPFHQLDIRVDKRWKFKDFSLGAYLDLINAYNRKNPDLIQYNYDFSASKPQSASLPIIPSLGLRGEF
jgi:TonB family protein